MFLYLYIYFSILGLRYNPTVVLFLSELLSIPSDFQSKDVDIEKRKYIIISARIHPGEANGSWMMHGVLEYLLSKDPAVKELLKMY